MVGWCSKKALPCLEDDIAITHLTYGKDLKWESWSFFLVVRFPVFFGGWRGCWDGRVPWWEACWWIILHEEWQLSYQATLKTVFLLKISEPEAVKWPKLWGCHEASLLVDDLESYQSIGTCPNPSRWKKNHHYFTGGPLFTPSWIPLLQCLGSIQTINVKSNWVSMFPDFVLNLL